MPDNNFFPPKGSNIVVGISGGVDSAVTALLLKQQGYKVTGVFMQNWEEDEHCTARQDYADAQGVCQQIGINLQNVNFAKEYWEEVFEDFLSEYKAFRTPNPDILCNKNIKFKHFLHYASKLRADYIATGHYARIQENQGQTNLLKGVDASKDQSYFLHAVSQEALAKSCFPLGSMHKSQVREIAKKHNLVNFSKKDSTGICFIGERKFKDFLNQYIPTQPGNIVTLDGRTIGTHYGLMFYTIGQRQGLGIGGSAQDNDDPWYVARKDIATNCLVAVQGTNNPNLFASALEVQKLHWIHEAPNFPLQCKAKIRYRQTDQDCTVTVRNNVYHVSFSKPQRAVTLGQSLVLYADDICLGGGVITNLAS